jgi:hypothetical protein
VHGQVVHVYRTFTIHEHAALEAFAFCFQRYKPTHTVNVCWASSLCCGQLLTTWCDLLLTLLHNPGSTHGTPPPFYPTSAAACYLWLLLSCMRR